MSDSSLYLLNPATAETAQSEVWNQAAVVGQLADFPTAWNWQDCGIAVAGYDATASALYGAGIAWFGTWSPPTPPAGGGRSRSRLRQRQTFYP